MCESKDNSGWALVVIETAFRDLGYVICRLDMKLYTVTAAVQAASGIHIGLFWRYADRGPDVIWTLFNDYEMDHWPQCRHLYC
jgi:hypothetical protein